MVDQQETLGNKKMAHKEKRVTPSSVDEKEYKEAKYPTRQAARKARGIPSDELYGVNDPQLAVKELSNFAAVSGEGKAEGCVAPFVSDDREACS